MLNNTLLGTLTGKNIDKVNRPNYLRMKENQIAKRRAKNKMARKSRRLNQIRQRGLNCKFNAKG
jgi:hypothetical protein